MVAIDLDQAPEPETKSPNPNNQSSTTACEEEDDSWEARMFEEDTLGCTWPPRSYMCTFCKRVFGSAQALGGHMNVHRRERARLNRATRIMSKNPSSSSSSALIIPTQELFASGNGLCLLYSFPNPNPNPNPNPIMVPAHAMDPSTHRSFTSISPPALAANRSSSVALSSLLYPPSNSEEVVLGLGRNGGDGRSNNEATVIDRSPSVADGDEEIDLELRLGRRSSPPWTVMAKRIKGSLD